MPRGTGLVGAGWSEKDGEYEKREGGKRATVSQDKDGQWIATVTTPERKLLSTKVPTQGEAFQRVNEHFTSDDAQAVRKIMKTDPLQDYDDRTLDLAAKSIATSGKFAPRLDPYLVYLWRITGKRKRNVEFSVDYNKHPLGVSSKYSTRKMTIPLVEEQ